MPLAFPYPASSIRSRLFALRDDTAAQKALKEVFQIYCRVNILFWSFHALLIAPFLGAVMSVYFMFYATVLYMTGPEISVFYIHQFCETLFCGILSAVLFAALYCQKQYILAGMSAFFSLFSWLQFGKMLFAVGMALFPLSPISASIFGESTMKKLAASAELREEVIHFWTTRIVLYHLYYQFLQYTALVTAKCGVFFVLKKNDDKMADTTYLTLL